MLKVLGDTKQKGKTDKPFNFLLADKIGTCDKKNVIFT